MARSIDVSVESPAGVEQVLRAFGDEDYWRARFAVFGNGTSWLDSLTVDPDGTVTVAVTQSLVRERLPAVITRLHGGDLTMVRNEKWSRASDGEVRGELGVEVGWAPVSADGAALLTPVPGGSRLSYATSVEVNLPLVGGRIEGLITAQLADAVPAVQRFTSEWIDEQG